MHIPLLRFPPEQLNHPSLDAKMSLNSNGEGSGHAGKNTNTLDDVDGL